MFLIRHEFYLLEPVCEVMVRSSAYGLGGDAVEHEADHDEGDHGFGHLGQVFVVEGPVAEESKVRFSA